MNPIDYEILAAQIRILAIKGIHQVGVGHVGGSMSIADLMAVLYGSVMNVRTEDPNWSDRDWLVVSKGHSGPAVYAALAKKGFFDENLIFTLNKPKTSLPSHCDRNTTPGIDMTTGSLGQGMSTAIGVAWANRYNGHPGFTYLVIGDGEAQEGQIWEGAMFAAQHKLSNLIAFIDLNQKQLDGYTDDICSLGDVARKFEEFGWYTIECDGHDHMAIIDAIALAKKNGQKPSMVILKTVKGQGCTFAENVLYNHHMPVSDEDCQSAIARLEKEIEDRSAIKAKGGKSDV